MRKNSPRLSNTLCSFNICQHPQQPTAMPLAVRGAGLGLPLPQGSFAGKVLLDWHLYWWNEVGIIKKFPTLPPKDKIFPAGVFITGIRFRVQLKLCSQPQGDWAAVWLCLSWGKATEKMLELCHITLRPAQLRVTISLLGSLKSHWNTSPCPLSK